MSDSEPHRPRRGPAPSRIALIACLAVIAVLLGALVVRGLSGGEDDDSVVKLDDMVGSPPARSGEPDAAAMLDSVIREHDGRETTLREQLGDEPILVNLWSRTCVPCLREMPWLEAVHRDDDRIRVVGVNQLDQIGAAADLAQETGITYPWYLDGGGDVGYHGRSVGLPDTYLFDTDGRLLGAKLGVFDGEPALRTWIDEHLDRP